MPHLKPSLKRPHPKRMRHSVRLTPSPPKNSPNRKTSKNANAKANAKANSHANAKTNAKANYNAKAMENRIRGLSERRMMSAKMKEISRRVLPQ